MSESVDAVVIGAGPNGLVAANLLADAGWDVLVLEAGPSPGGAVRTAELTAPGFRNDVLSAFYPLAAVSPVINSLDLGAYGLRWRHAPAALAHVLPDDRSAVISRELDTTIASVREFAPEDGDAWQDEFTSFTRMKNPLINALFQPFPPVRAGLRLARTLGVADGLRFARLVTMPVRTLAEERFRGAGARLLLAGNAQHTDLGPDDAGSAVFGWLLAMLAQDVGFPVPEGGAGRLTIALANRLAAAGGRIECDRAVTRVHTAGGEAVGVTDVTGRVVRARRAVLATVPAPTLYENLLSPHDLPPRLLRDLKSFHWDDGTVKVDWALDRPVPWRNPEVSKAGTVHLGGDMHGLARYHQDISAGRVPVDPFLLMGQMTTADDTRSPEGTESAWVYTHVPREYRWDTDSLRHFADRLEAVVERHAPGFTGTIKDRCVQGPGDLCHVDGNLLGGSINAGTAAIHQQLFFRPVPGLSRADTPVDRLYLAGASAHPGGAVHGGPGANAARAALRRAGRGGRAYRAVIQRLNDAVYRD
ncbi:NAD(P)/FAD-dependent oxidoreductase [Amycolatopsis sp. K13G38]|uniref:Pyridine nucleotide-disulfide oxidoreductase domain-containing protein 2 n=1 Tax=Amycolatopsis acididurans TaxID=2724524 RepID=A0ABX1JAQ9_9PSEU|nr:NAD(P)/FAD-dependent oxidoreductase [Amycolatopsis acididurans]NKQ56880.1 NAD(P)/FAD-dependent oxidoreductase [Amycolatopsis acididurans]